VEGGGDRTRFTEEKITEVTMLNAFPGDDDGRELGAGTESRTAETEQLMAAEGEERQTFAIKSVVNPADGAEISLQQAIVLGVIQPEEGVYVNSVTGVKKPIPSAMSEGLIKVLVYTINSAVLLNLPLSRQMSLYGNHKYCFAKMFLCFILT